MSNPYLNRLAKRHSGSHGQVSEKRVAKGKGARSQPGSGSLAGAKGDMRLADYIIEAKATKDDSMSVKLGWLVKIATEAMEQGRMPALTISFTMPDGSKRRHGDWVLIPLSEFEP